jgi:hypothetical protein
MPWVLVDGVAPAKRKYISLLYGDYYHRDLKPVEVSRWGENLPLVAVHVISLTSPCLVHNHRLVHPAYHVNLIA